MDPVNLCASIISSYLSTTSVNFSNHASVLFWIDIDKKIVIGKFILFWSISIVLEIITPSFSNFFILFQQGVEETPTFLDSSDRGIETLSCNSLIFFYQFHPF